MFACFVLIKGSVVSSLAPSPVSFKRNLLLTYSSDAAARLTHSGSEDGLKDSFIQAFLGGQRRVYQTLTTHLKVDRAPTTHIKVYRAPTMTMRVYQALIMTMRVLLRPLLGTSMRHYFSSPS